MESDIKIFDKNGKSLNIGDVISRFIIEKANKHKVKVAEVALFLEDGLFEVASLDDDYKYITTLEGYKPNGL
jgi:hypothetical protein